MTDQTITNIRHLWRRIYDWLPFGASDAAKEDAVSYREQHLIIEKRKENGAKQMRLLASEIRGRPLASSPPYDLARVAEVIAILFEVI